MATYNKYDGTNNVNVDNLATTTADLNSPADYAFTYQYNVNAGDDVAQCIITGQNNFDGSIVLTFDIAKADIYVLPLAAEKNYGAADPTDVATAFAGEANPSVYQYKLAKFNNTSNEYEVVPNAVLNGTVRLQREAGEAVSTYKIYFKSYTPDANVADNYDVQNTAELETENTAKRTAIFNLKKASVGLNLRFKSTAKNSKVYGDGTPKWTIDDLEPVPGNEGFVGNDDWPKVKPTLSAPVFTLADENVSYANNQVTVSNLASTNYPTVTVEPMAFTVTKRPIAITVQAQTRDYGLAPEQDAAGTGNKWSVDDAKSYKNVTSPEGEPIASANQVGKALVGTDEASVLEIELYLENDAYSYTPGQTHPGVIKARIKAENSNYELNENCVPGDLTINPETAFVLADTDDALDTKLASVNGESYPVKFGNMPIEAQKWYAMVLPFETTPEELVKKLGTFLIVNRLSSATISDDANKKVTVKFGLEWNVIPAGVPFLIKTAKATNWNKTTTVNNNEFESRELKANIEGETKGAASFLGTYATGKSLRWGYDLDGNAEPGFTYVDKDNTDWSTATLKYRYLDVKDQKWYNQKNSAQALKPMEAYLKLDAAALNAHVFVEDFENGTTAIKSLSTDDIEGLKTSEGWYTIDGIRLQGAPTEKGIYINNGKKVVVK